MLTNDEVLEINQDPAGYPTKRIKHDATREIWAKPLENGDLAGGLFNPSEKSQEFTILWDDLGLQGHQQVRDLWRQKDLGAHDGTYTALVEPHGVVLVRIIPL